MTATPQCVIDNQKTGKKYCIPVCSSSTPRLDAQCGTNASCKAASSTDSLCTYDDAPPGPSSSHWKSVQSPDFDKLSEAVNVAFSKDGTVGYCGAGSNGLGPEIVKTTDSGITWTRVWPDGNPNLDLFLVCMREGDKQATNNSAPTPTTLTHTARRPPHPRTLDILPRAHV